MRSSSKPWLLPDLENLNHSRRRLARSAMSCFFFSLRIVIAVVSVIRHFFYRRLSVGWSLSWDLRTTGGIFGNPTRMESISSRRVTRSRFSLRSLRPKYSWGQYLTSQFWKVLFISRCTRTFQSIVLSFFSLSLSLPLLKNLQNTHIHASFSWNLLEIPVDAS